MIPGSVILDLRCVTSDLYLLYSNLLPGVKELIAFLDFFCSLLVKQEQTIAGIDWEFNAWGGNLN
jgi:hypothetical protein